MCKHLELTLAWPTYAGMHDNLRKSDDKSEIFKLTVFAELYFSLF